MRERTKRLVSLFLAVCLSVTLAAPAASATDPEGGLWTDHADPVPESLVITSAEELAGLAVAVNNGTNYSGLTVTLSGNIDLSAYDWVPIGTGNKFMGTFNGGGFAVTGLTISPATYTGEYFGLFGAVENAVLEQVSATAVIEADTGSYTGNLFAGALAGHARDSDLIGCSTPGSNITTLLPTAL